MTHGRFVLGFLDLAVRQAKGLPASVGGPAAVDGESVAVDEAALAGSARKAMARAMSSGEAKRPMGMRLVMSASV